MKTHNFLLALLGLFCLQPTFGQAPAQSSQSNETNLAAASETVPAMAYEFSPTWPPGSTNLHGEPLYHPELFLLLTRMEGSFRRGLLDTTTDLTNHLNRIEQNLKPSFFEKLWDSYLGSLTWEFFGIHRGRSGMSILLGKILTAGGGLLLILKIAYRLHRLRKPSTEPSRFNRWLNIVLACWSALLLLPVTFQVWTAPTGGSDVEIGKAAKAIREAEETLAGLPKEIGEIKHNQTTFLNLLEACCASESGQPRPTSEIREHQTASPDSPNQLSSIESKLDMLLTNTSSIIQLGNEVALIRTSLSSNIVLSASVFPDNEVRSKLKEVLAKVSNPPKSKSNVPIFLLCILVLVAIGSVVLAPLIWKKLDFLNAG